MRHPLEEACGIRVIAYARLRSTQQKAIEELEAERLVAPAVIVTARQTAGRGQHTNRWWSDAGSLCATFVLPAASWPPGQIPLRAGLAVAEVVAHHAPRADVRVKWPNDVLVDGRKIAGVLCERRRECDVIGIGLNLRVDLRRAPPDVRHSATSLCDWCIRPPTRHEALIALGRSLSDALSRPDLLDAYTARTLGFGHMIRVRTAKGDVEGRRIGVDEEGRLLVQTSNGLIRVTDSDQIMR